MRANGRGISANVGVEDSRWSTRKQLVGGTVEVQLAEKFLVPQETAALVIRATNPRSAPLKPTRVAAPTLTSALLFE